MRLLLPLLVLAVAGSASAQISSEAAPELLLPPQWLQPSSAPSPDGVGQLLDFRDSDIKFNLRSLMEILRDHRHEGWVLAAYPDPNTGRPLIGAGFSLDVLATVHPQRDPLNPHPFIEPSSAQLWQGAGLAPDRLQQILDQFERNSNAWTTKQYRRKVVRQRLTPQLTEEEATQLLRISAIQAVYNAKAYCRGFDSLTGSQQMALSQLVFQMGVNLQEFVQFLGAVNNGAASRDAVPSSGAIETDLEHWKAVQHTLIQSQWAHRYSGRAATVIAMFDPQYEQDPRAAERQVEATLRPAVVHRRRGRSAGSLRVASYSRRVGRSPHKRAPRSQGKRKLA